MATKTRARSRGGRAAVRNRGAAATSRRRQSSPAVTRSAERAAEVMQTPWTMRRWESSETNRLNSAHWAKVSVSGTSINADLVGELDRLRARSSYEVANNPTLEGVIHTFNTDVTGRNGPKLQVLSDEDDYNDALEAVWKDEFCKEPDVAGQLGMVEYLSLWGRGLWTCGEYLAQKVISARALAERKPIATRLKTIDPWRLATPWELTGDPDVVMGVRRSTEGEPLAYTIAEPARWAQYGAVDYGKYRTVDAANVIHRFVTIEPDQARGVPWLATPLQAAADDRDYDAQVLDAARQAADQAVFWYTDHAEAEFLLTNETSEIERRTQSTGPPGWKPAMLTPSQPAQNYVEYKGEKQRDYGRPVGMPLMMVRLDSSKHNYSSARFDGQIYARGIAKFQGWLERRTLNGLVEDVRREAELYAAGNPRWQYAAALRQRPRRVEYRWIWPVMPHVDPAKEATAERIRLENGTLSYPDALAANGLDEDEQIATRQKTNKKLAEAGLPPLPTLGQAGGGVAGGADLAKVQELRDAAEAAEEKGESETAAALNAQAEELEKSLRATGPAKAGGGAGAGAGAVGPVGLNGAQITAAAELMDRLRSGRLVPVAAVGLLASCGIPRDEAEKMVAATPVEQQIADKQHKQDVVKALIGQAATAAVVANQMKLGELVEQSGVPRDPSYTPPRLPVEEPEPAVPDPSSPGTASGAPAPAAAKPAGEASA